MIVRYATFQEARVRGDDELAIGAQSGQRAQQRLLLRWMEVQLKLIDQYDRSGDI